ncbi:MAG: hypothetical protein M1504_02205 [Candidatus Marsarchaeota archaeon]|nr:hypothetical protein [Candidatus Marsarchaeota archaeon]
MFALLVIVPLLAAALLALPLKRFPNIVKYIAFAASLVSLLLAYLVFSYGPFTTQSFNWFSANGISFNISIATLPLNMLLLMVVSLITPLVFLYSLGFMEVPSEQPRFFFEMSIFAASMMLFAISANFITMFIAWEMLGITSYLLIGFWYHKEHAPTAARKAITTILIGDIFMLAAILIIGTTYGTFGFSAIMGSPSSPALYVALSFILIAAFTKSAQFPFHEWLSDAMEGPTPVSAFLHSSTMVKAGVFLIAVLFPLYVKADMLGIILVIGLVSAILGATNALTERHIKKILAYSTIEDLGLMFVALGLGSVMAAMMLFFVQAFYKALLFMGAGYIMKANDEKEDIYSTYGSSTRKLVFLSIVIAAVSLAGLFPMSGFFGKDAVNSVASNMVVYSMLLLIGFASSIYIFRWLFIPLRKSYESGTEININYKSTPRSMLIPMFILAALVFVADYAYLKLPGFLNGSYSIALLSAVVGNVIAVIGIIVAYRVYMKGFRAKLSSTNKMLFNVLYSSRAVNAVYLYIVGVTMAFARAVSAFDFSFDKSIYGLARSVITSGNGLRKIVNGQTNSYVFAFVLGIMFLIVLYVLA